MKASSSGSQISGHYELVYPTEYVKAADLRGKDVTVIISHLTWENLVMAGGKRDRKVAIHLRNVKGAPLGKKWIAGKTVLKQIAQATGKKDVSEWSGQRVTMYPTTCKGARGEEMECIRVRVRVNATATEIPEDMAREPEPRPEFVDEAEASEDIPQ